MNAIETEPRFGGFSATTESDPISGVTEIAPSPYGSHEEAISDRLFFLKLLKDAVDTEPGYTAEWVTETLLEVRDGVRSVLTTPHGENPLNLNNLTAATLANDKTATDERLGKAGIKTIPGVNVSTKVGADQAMAYAASYGYPIFMKPNDGTYAQGARPIFNENQLAEHMAILADSSETAMVQRFIQAREFRIQVVNGRLEYAFERIKANVAGDGQSTIIELIRGNEKAEKAFNENQGYVHDLLAHNGLSIESVLPEGEKLILSPEGSLIRNTELGNYTEEVPAACEEWAKRVADVMGLDGVCGIDVFAPNGLDDDPDNFTAIEVNANGSILGPSVFVDRRIGVDIFRRMLVDYFERLSTR